MIKTELMRNLVVILLIGICLTSNAQKTITYDKLHKELVNYPESAMISIYSNQLEEKSQFYLIELVTDFTLYGPPIFDNETQKQLTTDILTTGIERKQIIDYLNNNGFLEKLYLRIDQHYSNIRNHKDSFLINEPLIVFEIFHTYENQHIQTYLKLDDFEKANKLLISIGKILDKKERIFFKELSRNIKKLNK